MTTYLYVCLICRRQTQKVFHHKEEVPRTILCPYCGQPITQFLTPQAAMAQAPSGPLKPKIAKEARRR